MYKINVENPAAVFDIDPAQIQWDLLPLANGQFHILTPQGKSYTATVVEANYKEKSFRIDINGNIYSLSLKDQFDQLAEKMGLGGSSGKKANQLKAPMPGLVQTVIAKAGDSVRKGDILLILEAMKMENAIKAPNDAVVRSIQVQKGNTVDKGQLLVEFE